MAAYPKTVAHRNPDLLKLADGKPCLLLATCNRPSDTVACHSNFAKHGIEAMLSNVEIRG